MRLALPPVPLVPPVPALPAFPAFPFFPALPFFPAFPQSPVRLALPALIIGINFVLLLSKKNVL